MMENSKIEWTHHTFNPWIGCTKVSDGCKNCYAEALMDKRYKKAEWGPTGTRKRTSEAYWRKPFAWNKRAGELGIRERVFCASLADVFEIKTNWSDDLMEWRNDLWHLIYKTPNLDWLLLTKRPENVLHLWPEPAFENIWIGTSVESQEQAEYRIPHLLSIPATVRFLSCEPLLDWLDLSQWLPNNFSDGTPVFPNKKYIDWVIVGGESGQGARPMRYEWANDLLYQCQDTNTPYFFKQWGAWKDGKRVGKKKAGRLLRGQEWNEFPEVILSKGNIIQKKEL